MRLRELFEDRDNQVTFVFGRLNPPTIGHKQLLDTAAKQGGEYKIFVSQSQDPKKNPLDYDTKIKFIKAMFPEHAGNVIQDRALNTVVKVASWLYDQGYRKATFVAGSDRLEEMKKLLDQYNGVEGKSHGFYKFDQLNFVSSGEREDGAEGVAGISASGAREAAANDDFEAFQAATGAGKLAKQLYDAVREGMNANKSVAANRKTKELAETQLNEALPLLLPALATAARIGAPAIGRVLSRGAVGAGKIAAKNPKTTAVAAAAAADPEAAMNVVNVARNAYNLVSDPGAAAAAVAKGAWNGAADAAKGIAAIVGDNLTADAVKALAIASAKYALPIAGVVAILYGGKKLYDYISSSKPMPANKTENIIENIGKLFEVVEKDTEHYGNWTIEMSAKPVVMGKITGPEPKYVALITHKRKKDIRFYGTGTSQAAAREAGLKKAIGSELERSEDPDKFKSFVVDLNVDFTKEYLTKDSVPFYKFEKESGKIFLVQASKKYYQEFGTEIQELGFRKATGRMSTLGDMATQIYGFPISKNTVKNLGLIPNMRYTLDYVNDDEDGNSMYSMTADTRSQGPKDKYRMKRPGLIVAGTLADDVNSEDAAGVGIITKQNTTGDVNKGTIRKNLKAFNL